MSETRWVTVRMDGEEHDLLTAVLEQRGKEFQRLGDKHFADRPEIVDRAQTLLRLAARIEAAWEVAQPAEGESA